MSEIVFFFALKHVHCHRGAGGAREACRQEVHLVVVERVPPADARDAGRGPLDDQALALRPAGVPGGWQCERR